MYRLLSLLLFTTLFTTANAQIIISEIKLDSGWVELYNTTDSAINVSSWQLCDRPSYSAISSLTVISGSTTIPAQSYLVVAWSAIDATIGELGLYISAPFSSSANIRDYVQYGGIASPSRATVAVAAGVWAATSDFAPFPVLTNHSLENVNFQAITGQDTDLSTWTEGFNSTGASNHDNVIINEINLDSGWVELHNPTNGTINISSWRLCDRPAYAVISGLNVLSGSTTLGPDGFVVLEWSAISASVGELGLYITTPFSSVGNIKDYTQYGGIASPSRATVAVAAGVWTNTSDFIAFPDTAGNSLENTNLTAFSGIQTAVGDWSEDSPTPGVQNDQVICPPSYTAANGNPLTGIESGVADYETDGAIESDQTITTTGKVDYDSGTGIDLLENFEVQLGGELFAFIDGCNGTGGIN